jgi:hypothetical protein
VEAGHDRAVVQAGVVGHAAMEEASMSGKNTTPLLRHLPPESSLCRRAAEYWRLAPRHTNARWVAHEKVREIQLFGLWHSR